MSRTRTRRPRPLSNQKVLDRVRWLFEGGIVDRSFHFDLQAKERNVTQLDIEVLLSRSCQVVKKEYSTKHKSWKYTIEGVDEDGEPLSLVVSLDLKNSILKLITAF